jgi:hypothetical protein
MAISRSICRFFTAGRRRTAPSAFLPAAILLASCRFLAGTEVPLDLHGRGLFAKYLNSDTSRYYLETSVDIYCTMLRSGRFSAYLNYRDDLDVSGGFGGVFFDPRLVHYYMILGGDYEFPEFFVRLSYVHDCIHDIDFAASGKPIFNRFRIQTASGDFHHSRSAGNRKNLLWSLCFTYFAHWQYHGWDISAGADYDYEINARMILGALRKRSFGCDIMPELQLAKGDSVMYHQGRIGTTAYFINDSNRRFCLGLEYNIFNNDVLKRPEGLWRSYISVEF